MGGARGWGQRERVGFCMTRSARTSFFPFVVVSGGGEWTRNTQSEGVHCYSHGTGGSGRDNREGVIQVGQEGALSALVHHKGLRTENPQDSPKNQN